MWHGRYPIRNLWNKQIWKKHNWKNKLKSIIHNDIFMGIPLLHNLLQLQIILRLTEFCLQMFITCILLGFPSTQSHEIYWIIHLNIFQRLIFFQCINGSGPNRYLAYLLRLTYFSFFAVHILSEKKLFILLLHIFWHNTSVVDYTCIDFFKGERRFCRRCSLHSIRFCNDQKELLVLRKIPVRLGFNDNLS